VCDDRRVERAAGWISSTWHELSEVPVPLRYALFGGAAGGALGGVVGLVIGLLVHPPTAWFAIFEVGLPAAVLGFLLGLVVGSVTHLVSRRRGRPPDVELNHRGE
jgi:MFS family permease